jgi:hypothetical protein
MKRDGNTLSMVARNAWDDKPLQSMTKNSPQKATRTHITIIGHVTKSELLKHLTEEKLGYGIANRFLFFLVRRVNILPLGGGESPITEDQMERLRRAIEFGAVEREIPLSGGDENGTAQSNCGTSSTRTSPKGNLDSSELVSRGPRRRSGASRPSMPSSTAPKKSAARTCSPVWPCGSTARRAPD